MAEINSLGGLLPVINKGISVFNTVDRLAGHGSNATEKKSRARQQLALTQMQEQQKTEEQIAAQKFVREKSVIDAQAADDERRRMSALKRASAAQRAAYGGAGVESDAGSGEAVLLGLFSQSEEEKVVSESINALRRQILDDNMDAIRTRNLLELSQARARYNLSFE